MNIKNAWMGWVPLLQYYTMTQVAWVDFKKYMLYPILIIIAVAIFWWVWFALGWELSLIIWMIAWIGYIIAFIYYLVRYINILSATSKRTWRGGWTTFGLFFVPFIMYPVIASKFKGLKEENKEEKKVVEL
jgi:NADH:ubiquinone oxidoreductase subunit 6 (subunit J)